MFYRNTGAPFWRGDGPLAIEVPKGHVFEPTDRELRQFGYKLEPVGEKPGATDSVVGPPPVPPPPLPKEWPVAMRPELYLQLHPDGVHADLARRIVAGMAPPPTAPAPAPAPAPPLSRQRDLSTRDEPPADEDPRLPKLGRRRRTEGPDAG
jgi:hypothetical protein